MVIIFYDPKTDKVHVCTKDYPIRIFDADDEAMLENIPDDDVLYVKSGRMMTKRQFEQFFHGEIEWEDDEPTPIPQAMPQQQRARRIAPAGIPQPTAVNPNRTIPASSEYIRPTGQGIIIIADLVHEKLPPQGLILRGPYDFFPVDSIGKDTLERSAQFRVLLAKKKVEYVDAAFVQANAHKKDKQNFTDRELDRMMVPEEYHARAVAAAGGLEEMYGSRGRYSEEDRPIEIGIVG